MATFEEIKSIRLFVDDPQGVIDLIEVANIAALPATLAPQTGYKTADTFLYYVDSKTVPVSLLISDAQISSFIDTYGIIEATCKTLEQIIMKLGRQLPLKKSTFGADSYEYTSLKELQAYYEAALKRCKSDSDKASGSAAGRWGQVSRPEIAGGDL